MANILHISRTMGQGGAEKVVFQLATSLRDEFNHVVVASTGGHLVDALSQKSVQHIALYDIETKKVNKVIQNLIRLIKTVKKFKITHIHAHHRMGLLYCQLLKLFYPKMEFFYTAHNIFSQHNKLYQQIIKNIHVIAVGEGVKRHLIDDVNVPSEAIHVIYNGVKNEESPQEIDTIYSGYKGKKILCVARLSEQKGIEYLIKALSQIKRKDFKLFLLGEGELFTNLVEEVEREGLQERVEFLGYKHNVQDYIQKCYFMILPSLWEGFPLTPIECFMNKKTMIATDIPGTNEIVNQKNGILVNPKNSDALAEAITYLLDYPQIVNEKEIRAYETFEDKFSYQKFLDDYRRLYFKE